MGFPKVFKDMPVRLAAGSFILNSGRSKFAADAQTEEHLHQMAISAYPFLADVPTDRFIKMLASAEVSLGAALMLPFIPSRLVGLGLAGFASGLVGMYLRIPGLREEGSLRPTQDGTALAKDVWLLGAGLTLMAHGGKKRR